ncbi:DUF924 domain-containing protein [Saccharobesus litoralis]|uniref:DUF924 domain-containing protein n=1 Tax=Saccharobesus litoralis TaxID=2172099 RepID=A0A2S0VLT9_9ALTE|nr:DUF924 family protein [Saccharobesus litoralis]AWB65184.1 DUF924 domain-containing protein [Saccharobesus litoralis]
MSNNYSDVIEFWFEQIPAQAWWQKNNEFDALVTQKFANTLCLAEQELLPEWRQSAEGRLAEIIVLDQFSRNIYRGTAKAFANDNLALLLAQQMIELGLDKHFIQPKLGFVYMPFMHSESKEVHEQAVLLFSQADMQTQLDFELRHKAIIDQFGRYPHRNHILGRISTAEEVEFLQQPGSSF